MTHINSQWFDQFLNRLREGCWQSVFSEHGWDLISGTSQVPLTINRALQGFEEFAKEGQFAIHPGDPALSLLYHALMHPGVQGEAITFWPDLNDIDNLENYIYSLAPIAEDELASLHLVVMAYEYRVTRRTPHQKHADLIFSRTGVGRVGNEEPKYSGERRCFITNSERHGGCTRVQPARYGLFLCEAKCYGEGLSIQGKKHSQDELRIFYRPVSKIYNGMTLAGQTLSLRFEAFHQSDKLMRMVSKGKLKIDSGFDINKPPFHYQSDKDDIVGQSAYTGNLLVWRKAQDFCRMAKQGDKVVTFTVPKESYLSIKKALSKVKNLFFLNNRRYTSLRVGQSVFWVMLDYLINGLLSKIGSDKRAFFSPRQAGEFTNIRHIINDEGEVVDLNLLSIKEFKSTLSEGGYQAIMYEDAIAEGYVSAKVTGLERPLAKVKVAYSLMTAPDFMPHVGNIDIYQYKDNFVTGGPRALCEGRLAVNLRLTYQGSKAEVFSPKEQTVTAITAHARDQAQVCLGQAEYENTHYMTDEASDIFAPGWDVTYGRESLCSSPYYHTSGLGAPFLEDVKLCAAANGMWPAASPDAARTFKRKTRTALPLTDEELGIAPKAAFAQNGRISKRGWDGEYGPFIFMVDDKPAVNYASIDRSDYIRNHEENKLNFSQLRLINRPEADQRLKSLAAVNKLLLGDTDIDGSGFWLVSFVKVAQWRNKKGLLNMPATLWKKMAFPKTFFKQDNKGYFYIFAKYSQESYATEQPIRRIQAVDSLHFVKAATGKTPQVFQCNFSTLCAC